MITHANANTLALTVFISSDYAFLADLYGLSGVNGVHLCLWCDLKKCNLITDGEQIDKSTHKSRTLDSIKSDFYQF